MKVSPDNWRMVERTKSGEITVKFLNPKLSVEEAVNLSAWLLYHACALGFQFDDLPVLIREIQGKLYFPFSPAANELLQFDKRK